MKLRRFAGPILSMALVATTLLVGSGTASAAPAPMFVTAKARHSGKCLDVSGGSTNNGANLIQWECHGGANQHFLVLPLGGGGALIVARHSGHCLDVSGGSTANGAAIIQWPCHGGLNQQWVRRDTSDGQTRLVARHSGKCVDVAGASNSNGARIIQWPCHNQFNQQWRIS